MAVRSTTGFPCKCYTHSTNTEGVCLNLKWTVKNFDKLLSRTDYKFPPIRPTPQCDLEVRFRKDRCTLELFVDNKLKKSDVYFDATTIICDENEKQLYQEAVVRYLLNEEKTILPKLNDRYGLPGSLIIEIKLELYNLTSEKCDIASLEKENEFKLAEDMINFILSELPAEVVLETKDGDEISANKAILRARSPVFQKMFDHPMSEQEKNIVHVDDVTGTILRTLVQFLYSGKVELPKTELTSLKELYYAADKYQVLDLRKMCAQTMLPMLNDENALEFLMMAHRHSDKYLKEKCMIFIQTRIEAFMGTEGWMNLKVSDPGLVMEVFETFWGRSAALQQKSI